MATTRQKALKIMLNSGINTKMRGFPYLVRALEMCYDDREYMTLITKRLYPAIAEQFNTTQTAVERVMRYAIDKRNCTKCSVGEFLSLGVYLMELE